MLKIANKTFCKSTRTRFLYQSRYFCEILPVESTSNFMKIPTGDCFGPVVRQSSYGNTADFFLLLDFASIALLDCKRPKYRTHFQRGDICFSFGIRSLWLGERIFARFLGVKYLLRLHKLRTHSIRSLGTRPYVIQKIKTNFFVAMPGTYA